MDPLLLLLSQLRGGRREGDDDTEPSGKLTDIGAAAGMSVCHFAVAAGEKKRARLFPLSSVRSHRVNHRFARRRLAFLESELMPA